MYVTVSIFFFFKDNQFLAFFIFVRLAEFDVSRITSWLLIIETI